jgi:hypothetical protein
MATTPDAVPNGIGVQIWIPAITIGMATGRDAAASDGKPRARIDGIAVLGGAAAHVENTCSRYA